MFQVYNGLRLLRLFFADNADFPAHHFEVEKHTNLPREELNLHRHVYLAGVDV